MFNKHLAKGSQVPDQVMSEVVSSASRLTIADMISARPRTLSELSKAAGISVQGVLKHLTRLDSLGLLEEMKVSLPGVRKAYSLKGAMIGDFGIDDLMVVKFSRRTKVASETAASRPGLEVLGEESIMLRRRVREQVRRAGRMIEELYENQEELEKALSTMNLPAEDLLVLQVLYSEESRADAERVLAEEYGIPDPGRTIERAASKVRRTAR